MGRAGLEEAVSRVEIWLFGGLKVRLDGQELGFPTRHCGLLLAYLALTPGGSRSREHLASLLWGERAEEQARASLRQTLYLLRQLFAGLEPPLLAGDTRSLRLDDANLWCDVSALEQSLDSVGQDLDQALALYRGELLAECGQVDPAFDSWLVDERLRLHKRVAAGFVQLARRQLAERRFEAMEASARKLTVIDPFDEEARRLLMTACTLQGRRNTALAVFEDLVLLLRRELAVSPEPATRELAEKIRGGAPVVETAGESAAEQEPEPSSPVLEDDATEDRSQVLGPERRLVTLMAVAVEMPRQDAAGQDPETASNLLAPLVREALGAVRRFGGQVASHVGDEMQATFGAEHAQEDHALRACNAALAIRGAARSLPGSLSVRVGLHSGEVVLRQAADGGERAREAVGPAVALAARIARTVPAGTIGLSHEVRDGVEGFFELGALAASPPDGGPGLGPLFELGAGTGARTRWQAASNRPLSRFVGRESEMADLARALSDARKGRGSVAAVTGDAGLGKSRLLHEFLQGADAAGCTVLEAGAASHDEQAIYLPISRLLRAWLAVRERDDRATIAAKLERRLKDREEELQAAVPALRSLLDLEAGDDAWAHLSPAQRRRQTIEAVKTLFVSESSRQPMILVVEDLHWIDGETQAVLDRLVLALPRARLLLLVTYRPEYRHAWIGKSFFRLIRVDALGREGARALAGSLLGEDPALAHLRELLAERTGGVPFFIEESVRSLVDASSLAGRPGAYRLAKTVDRLDIPASVQDVLAARIDRLPAGQKALLQIASVIGVAVPYPLVRALSELDEENLDERLAGLQSAELLYEAPGAGDLRYEFKHALTHDVAYGSLLVERRAELHARLVEIMEEHYGDRLDEQVERLAHHAQKGRLWDRASRALARSAEKTVECSAYRQALSYLTGAIEALAQLPEASEVARREIDLRLALRAVLIPLGDFAAGRGNLGEAEALAGKVDDRRRLAAIHLHKSYLFSSHGRFDEAEASAGQADAIAQAGEDEQLRHEARLALCQAAALRGDSRRVVACLTPFLDYWREANRLERFGQAGTRSVWCFGLLSIAQAELGAFDEALASAEEARSIAEETRRPIDLLFALHRQGGARLVRGEATAIAFLEESLALARTHDTPLFFAWLAGDLGWARALEGEQQEAARLLEQARETAGRLQLLQFEARALAYQSGLALKTGAGETAADKALAAIERAKVISDSSTEAMALRFLACALGAERGGEAAAQDCFAQAIALAEAGGHLPELGHCRSALGRWLAERERWREARVALAAAAKLYGQMGMARWQPGVERDLQRLGD